MAYKTSRLLALLVDDDRGHRQRLATQFEKDGWQVEQADDAASAIIRLGTLDPAIVVLEPNLAPLFWLRFMRKLRALRPDVRTVIATDYLSRALRAEG